MPRTVRRDALLPDARRTVETYERNHDTRFAHLLRFDPQALESLHAPGELPDSVRVASGQHPGVVERMAVVTAVAKVDSS
ncbi:hypothetical protein [Kitasatospora sp. NPDC001225]